MSDELSQEEKELIVVSLANSTHDPEQEEIHEDARKLVTRLQQEWGTPEYYTE